MMATIDENGKIRDGRDRKVDGTITKLKSGRFVFNCSACAEDFKYLEDIIGHINFVHSKNVTTHADENLTNPGMENTSASQETAQSFSSENKKWRGYTPFMVAMNEPNPISRYNSKVRLDMIVFDSKVKKEQNDKRFAPHNKERNSKPKLTIDRTDLANTISRLNIVNRRMESVKLVANELRLKLTNSSERLWLANKMKSPIDKMNRKRMQKTIGSKKTSFKDEPIASTSTKFTTSTDDFNGFTKKDSNNAMLKHSSESKTSFRLCRIKTEIDPAKVMHRYGINTYRKESVRFVAEQLNLKDEASFEKKSGSLTASFAIKKGTHQR